MFDNLSQRLSRVVKQLRGEARLTDANIADALREVRLAMLRPTSPCPSSRNSSRMYVTRRSAPRLSAR
jgi:signal recognition particle subunit SRP54